MPELNRTERRALVSAMLLVVLGAGARVVTGPEPDDYAWRPAAAGPVTAGGPAPVRGAVADALAREERALTPLAAGERVDPNRAPVEELRRLPGVGPSRAQAIIEGRRIAAYRSLEDLLRVPGIGPATLARLAPHLALEAHPVSSRASAARPLARPPPVGNPSGCPPVSKGVLRLAINRADSADLLRLPGVGPVRAGAILRLRSKLGRFRSVTQLSEIQGIGPTTVERLRLRVCID